MCRNVKLYHIDRLLEWNRWCRHFDIHIPINCERCNINGCYNWESSWTKMVSWNVNFKSGVKNKNTKATGKFKNRWNSKIEHTKQFSCLGFTKKKNYIWKKNKTKKEDEKVDWSHSYYYQKHVTKIRKTRRIYFAVCTIV